MTENFYDILDERERAYDTSQKYLNLVLEHAMEDEVMENYAG